jgi:urocanate hydratase
MREVDVQAQNKRTHAELKNYMDMGWMIEKMDNMKQVAPDLYQKTVEILIRRNSQLKPRS